MLAAIAVVFVGAGITVYALNGNGTNPASAVESAVANLHRAKTAEIAIAATIDTGGGSIKMTGNGETNVLTNATNETVTYNIGAESLSERAILDGPTAYFNYGPEVGRIVPRKSWVSMDVGQSNTSGSQGVGIYSDPVAMVAVLGSSGTVVHALGASTVNGVAVQGYGIDLSAAGIHRLIQSTYLPSSMKSELAASHFSRLDYIAFVDGSHHLTDVRTVADYSVAGEQFSARGDLSLSDYGVPVSITDPPASEVVPFQQFQRIAEQDQGTTSS